MANTAAWISPTNNSNNIKGVGTNAATKADITEINTSPANTLPNNLRDSDTTLAISETISIKPTPNSMTALNIAMGPFLKLKVCF